MKPKIYTFIAVLLATVLVAWVILDMGQNSDESILATLHDISSLDDRLNKEVGRTHLGFALNYDDLIAVGDELTASIEAFTASSSDEQLLPYQQAISTAHEEKQQSLEVFKYRNSVMRFIWHHYPNMSMDVLNQLESEAAAGNKQYEPLLSNTRQLIMSTSLFMQGAEESSDELKNKLAALEQQKEMFGGLSEQLNMLLDYSGKTLEYSSNLNSIVRSIYEHRLSTELALGKEFLEERYLSDLREVEQSRIAILVGAVLLMIALYMAFRRLNFTSVRLHKTLQRSEFQQYILDEHAMVTAVDLNGRIKYASDRFCERSGYSRDELLGQHRSLFNSSIHGEDFQQQLWQTINRGDIWQGDICIGRKDGGIFWAATTIVPKKDSNGNVLEFMAMRTDITAQKMAEEEISVLARISEENPEAVLRIDDDYQVIYANKPAGCLLDNWRIAVGEQVPEEWRKVFADALATGAEQKAEIDCDGRYFLLSIIPVVEAQYVNVYGRDITDRKQAEEELAYRADHDFLTGLLNRSAFERELTVALQSAEKSHLSHCLMYIDLDQFKIVNDTCGHVAGDDLLRQVARILQEAVRHSDIVARLGGDEFGVILWRCSPNAALILAEKISRTMNGFRFSWDDLFFDVGASIGIVQIDSNAAGIEELMGKADVACYSAKEASQEHIHVYQEQISEASVRHTEMRWASKIPKALADDQFCLVVQPIVALQTATDRPRYEVLIRMRDEEGGLLPPGHFLPAAERFKQIALIDAWVIRKVFEFMAEHADYMRCQNPVFAINLSGMSLGDSDILKTLTNCCEIHPHYVGNVHFEVTETSAIKDFSVTTAFIEKFLILGCEGISLDDFGSGMSSFAYLQQLPVDCVKVDGSFVKDMVGNRVNHSIVESVHSISHSLGMQTVAEWVENLDTVELLKEIGVDYIQGYAISKPFPIEQTPTITDWGKFSQIVTPVVK